MNNNLYKTNPEIADIINALDRICDTLHIMNSNQKDLRTSLMKTNTGLYMLGTHIKRYLELIEAEKVDNDEINLPIVE